MLNSGANFGMEAILDAEEAKAYNAIKFRHDEIYTTKKKGEKLVFLPSVFSLLYVSVIDYERIETKCNSPHIKATWFEKNKVGNNTL